MSSHDGGCICVSFNPEGDGIIHAEKYKFTVLFAIIVIVSLLLFFNLPSVLTVSIYL